MLASHWNEGWGYFCTVWNPWGEGQKSVSGDCLHCFTFSSSWGHLSMVHTCWLAVEIIWEWSETAVTTCTSFCFQIQDCLPSATRCGMASGNSAHCVAFHRRLSRLFALVHLLLGSCQAIFVSSAHDGSLALGQVWREVWFGRSRDLLQTFDRWVWHRLLGRVCDGVKGYGATTTASHWWWRWWARNAAGLVLESNHSLRSLITLHKCIKVRTCTQRAPWYLGCQIDLFTSEFLTVSQPMYAVVCH